MIVWVPPTIENLTCSTNRQDKKLNKTLPYEYHTADWKTFLFHLSHPLLDLQDLFRL
ncbi:21894_t:CDS:2 [Entrophospora sp. SA101]|nr:21894_t:CDS:2 [Entrophospora sp. SA101]